MFARQYGLSHLGYCTLSYTELSGEREKGEKGTKGQQGLRDSKRSEGQPAGGSRPRAVQFKSPVCCCQKI